MFQHEVPKPLAKLVSGYLYIFGKEGHFCSVQATNELRLSLSQQHRNTLPLWLNCRFYPQISWTFQREQAWWQKRKNLQWMRKVQLCISITEWPLSVNNRNGKDSRKSEEIIFWLAWDTKDDQLILNRQMAWRIVRCKKSMLNLKIRWITNGYTEISKAWAQSAFEALLLFRLHKWFHILKIWLSRQSQFTVAWWEGE